MLLSLLLLASSASASVPSSDWTVDLHQHPFMKTGLNWWFTGDFDGPLRARDWRSRFSSQINPEALARSGIGVVVVSLYAHPILAPNKRESIREQIRQAERFVAS